MKNNLIEDQVNLSVSQSYIKSFKEKLSERQKIVLFILSILFIAIFIIALNKNKMAFDKIRNISNVSKDLNKFKSFLQGAEKSNKLKKILVIGSIGYDLTTYYEKMPVIGETIVGRKFAENPGGKGDNQAVAGGRSGGDITFLGAIGDDYYGEILKKNLEVNNVKHNLKVVPNMNCQIATILVDQDGRNSIIIVPGANNYVDKKQIDENEKLIDENDIIVLQLEIPLETVEYIIDMAHKKNKIIILNPSPWQTLSENVLKKVDYLIPNEIELSLMTGMKTDQIEQIEIACKKIIELGAKNLIVTLGEKGSLLYNKEGSKMFPAFPVKAVDTTGAGDCFAGVFSTYLSKNYPIEEAIKYANLASSISVTKIGTIPSFPTQKEIEEARKKVENW